MASSMDWNNASYRLASFASRPESSLSFIYNYNYDQFPGLEMKQAPISAGQILPSLMGNIYGQDVKKKRLSSEQLESLENSFQEDIKLDPDRKMKLAKDLGLQPRQIAIWFQNRRARWKSKHLENLYDSLKQEFNAVCREKQKLQQEVMALRAILKDEIVKNGQITTGCTGEETVESTSIPSSVYEINVDDFANPMLITPYNYNLPRLP